MSVRRFRRVGDREVAARLHAHFERAWASPHAAGVRRSAKAPPRPATQLAFRQEPVQQPTAPATAWWRTVSDRASRCGCGKSIPPGERFVYRHSDHAIRCRSCAEDVWAGAGVSRRLKEFAERRQGQTVELPNFFSAAADTQAPGEWGAGRDRSTCGPMAAPRGDRGSDEDIKGAPPRGEDPARPVIPMPGIAPKPTFERDGRRAA